LGAINQIKYLQTEPQTKAKTKTNRSKTKTKTKIKLKQNKAAKKVILKVAEILNFSHLR